MIIWGSKGRKKVVGKGQFFCPRCNVLRPYEQIKIGKYFTLYFLPLFQTKTLAEYVECGFCRTPFEPHVLEYDHTAREQMRKSITNIRENLNAGMPVNVVYQGMRESGGSEDVINNIISMATGGKFKVCKNDQMVFSGELNFCPNCGNKLVLPD